VLLKDNRFLFTLAIYCPSFAGVSSPVLGSSLCRGLMEIDFCSEYMESNRLGRECSFNFSQGNCTEQADVIVCFFKGDHSQSLLMVVALLLTMIHHRKVSSRSSSQSGQACLVGSCSSLSVASDMKGTFSSMYLSCSF